MDTRRAIGNVPGNSGAVDSRTSLPRRLRETMSVLLVGLSLGTVAVHAQDATWLGTPVSGNWDAAANWSSAEIPTATAIFGPSLITTITFSSATTTIGALQFNVSPSQYFFSPTGVSLVINGAGINNAFISPTFTDSGVQTTISFNGASTAGNATIFAMNGGNVSFANTSKAGTATIFTDSGAFVLFRGGSTG
jgi:hypothetical protein